MSLEMLEIVCAAEEEARQAKILAEKKAQELMAEAEKAGKAVVKSTLARAETEIAHLMRASDQKATQEALELASSTANRLATHRARAERRLNEVAEKIYERIVTT